MVSHKYNLPFLGAPQKGCLCIDDICDTGDTALAWRNKGYTVATMFYNKGSKVIPDYWKYEKTNEWIVFPWEL
jgi:hypoxanthine phosphoribosyltransferase